MSYICGSINGLDEHQISKLSNILGCPVEFIDPIPQAGFCYKFEKKWEEKDSKILEEYNLKKFN